MDHTGERMVPAASSSSTFWEHVYRYQFAAQFAAGKRVLDIACGEGYGTKSLQLAGAKSALGIDISPEACEHARQKYGIETLVGDATSIPLPDRSLDLVVSFETIEHVEAPERFVAECRRILSQDGWLIISTPNLEVYNPDHDPNQNRYHCSEMSVEAFVALLQRSFVEVRTYSQLYSKAPLFSRSGLIRIRSAWRRIPGYSRWIAGRFPGADPQREADARIDPPLEILRPNSWIERFFNPFLVEEYSPAASRSPMFIVAIARTPKAEK